MKSCPLTPDILLSWIEFDTNGGCWLWRAPNVSHGYGAYWDGKRSRRAHRASYEMVKGPIAPGMVLLHRCDVPACVNPDHLAVGTQADNIADALRKGRRARKPERERRVAKAKPPGHGLGTGRANAKLTEEQVLDIRSSDESSRRLANRLSVSPSLIRQIRRGEAWASVPNQKDAA